jgi:hypothetical protein
VDLLIALSVALARGHERAKKKAASEMPPAERLPRAAQGEERRGD